MRKLSLLLILLLPASLFAAEYPVADPSVPVIGELGFITAKHTDTFPALGREYGVGFEELKMANPAVDPWLPGEGTVVTVPTRHLLPDAPREGIVINLPEYRLYYFGKYLGDGRISTFPISIGKQDWATPLGTTSVIQKRRNPTWFPPPSVLQEYAARGEPLEKAVPPGPDNPLGGYSMRLAIPGYLIHGTNKPGGLGMQVTHGCIRMHPDSIGWLFPQVEVGTPVTLVNQPYKFAYFNDRLYFQAFKLLEPEGDKPAHSMSRLMDAFLQLEDSEYMDVDWDLVDHMFRNPSGVPMVVGKRLNTKVIGGS